MFELMSDDRLLLHAATLRPLLDDKLKGLCGIHSYVWTRLAQLVGGVSWQSLRSDTLNAACISIAYFYRFGFAELSHAPLSLTQGDISQNVTDVASMAETPMEPISAAIWYLKRAEYWDDRIIGALELATNSPGSISMVGEGHASGAVLIKSRPGLTDKRLRSRALAHQCRALVTDSKFDKMRKGPLRKIEILDKKTALPHWRLPHVLQDGRRDYCAKGSWRGNGEFPCRSGVLETVSQHVFRFGN